MATYQRMPVLAIIINIIGVRAASTYLLAKFFCFLLLRLTLQACDKETMTFWTALVFGAELLPVKTSYFLESSCKTRQETNSDQFRIAKGCCQLQYLVQ